TLQATDPGGDPLTYQVISAPEHGTLLGTPPSLTYAPDADWNGVDSFTFQADDGTATDLGTVTLTLDPVPDAPRLDPIGNVVMVAGSTLSVPVSAVDPDGHAITLEAHGLPPFGGLTVLGNGVGELTFSPGLGDTGSFGALRITATDNVYTDEIVFGLVVEALSGPPIADDLELGTAEDTPLPFELAAVDPDGDPITYQITGGPEHGSLEGTPPSLTYVPGDDFFGTDSLTYTASDAGAASNPATVTFTVDPVADAPRLEPLDDLTLDEGAVLDLPILAVDPDGDAVVLSVSGLPAFASFEDAGDGSGTLHINPGFADAGVYPGIEVSAADGGLLDTATFTLTVSDHQAPPGVAFRPAKGINVAQLGSATVEAFSSQQSDFYGPDRAIDGLSNTLWRSTSNADEWLRLRLPGDLPHVLERVVLRGRGQSSGARTFELRVSTSTGTAEDFTTALSGEIPQDNDHHEFPLPLVPARRVELRIVDNWGHGAVTDLYHLELWTRDREGGILSLVSAGAAVADFSSERQDPERAFDLEEYTRWESANGQSTEQWLTVDLIGDQAYIVDRVRLLGLSIGSSPRNFEIRVSDSSPDPATMATVHQGELPAGGFPHWVFFEPVAARFVQLFVHDTQSDIGWVGVASFEVYSPQLGSPTVPFDDHSFDADGTIVGWSWDFGDGSTSTERHPVHTYAAPGTYEVSLTVTDDHGQSTMQSLTYTALAPPQAAFGWTPASVVEGDLVHLQDLSTDADGQVVAWRWTFHEGSVR
ncbi:MAG: Ig-like domain-containing protein, partial [Holophagales bacterium]|nr:Ig-like domain-containing protein [Holophagales bacterium]